MAHVSRLGVSPARGNAALRPHVRSSRGHRGRAAPPLGICPAVLPPGRPGRGRVAPMPKHPPDARGWRPARPTWHVSCCIPSPGVEMWPPSPSRRREQAAGCPDPPSPLGSIPLPERPPRRRARGTLILIEAAVPDASPEPRPMEARQAMAWRTPRPGGSPRSGAAVHEGRGRRTLVCRDSRGARDSILEPTRRRDT